MSLKLLAIGGLAAVVASCQHTASQVDVGLEMMKADTVSADTYTATALTLNAIEATYPASKPTAENIKGKAWGIWQAEHTLYTSGGATLAQLQLLRDQLISQGNAATSLQTTVKTQGVVTNSASN